MSRLTALFLLLLPYFGFSQAMELGIVLDAIQEELTDVNTEKYGYEQALEYDAEKPWRVTITITEVNLKNDKSSTEIFYFNLADLDPKLIKYETDKEEQLVVMKCRRRQDFIRLTDHDENISYESELQVWSPEIDQATALQDLLRQAATLAEEAWQADFSPGTTLEELAPWLEEHIVPVASDKASIHVLWKPSDSQLDQVILNITNADGKETNLAYNFSLADIAKNGIKLAVRKESVRVVIGTINRKNLIREEKEDILMGHKNSINIPVAGIEEASRIIQVLEAALPLARKLREARLPAPANLDDGLALLTTLVTGAERKNTNITASINPAPLATLELTSTDTEKDSESTESYLFDFSDLNAKNIELRVKGVALDVVAKTAKGQDFIQQWEDGEASGFEDKVAFPINTIEAGHQLVALLPYLIAEAAKLPVPVGDFSTIEKAVADGSEEETTQSIEQREEDCKWSFRQLTEGKKSVEILYEYNLYDLDPKQVKYEASNKGVFVRITTLKKEETINVYENDEPGFSNEMIWKMESLSAAKQVAATLINLIEGCVE
jgi:hypothetical protein